VVGVQAVRVERGAALPAQTGYNSAESLITNEREFSEEERNLTIYKVNVFL
jgi:hypothetical protein